MKLTPEKYFTTPVCCTGALLVELTPALAPSVLSHLRTLTLMPPCVLLARTQITPAMMPAVNVGTEDRNDDNTEGN